MKDKKFEIGYFINFGLLLILFAATLFFMTSSSVSVSIGIDTLLGKYITKSTASLIFVLCGVVNLVYSIKNKQANNLKYMILMMIGLVFAMLGDILLIEYFVIGALLFAVGHVFFMIAFFFNIKFKWRDLVIMLFVFIPSLLVILFYPKFVFDGMQMLVIAYALIISAMLGKAISNTFEKENRLISIIIMLGAIMFFLSDLMLLFNVFGNAPYVFDVLCIALYYPAEFVLAFTILLVGFRYNKK